MTRDHVSGHETTVRVSGSPDHTEATSWKEEKDREQERTKAYPKEAKEHSLAKKKQKILKCGQKGGLCLVEQRTQWQERTFKRQ